MMLKNDMNQYGAVAKLLHWLIALLIIGLIALGAYMVTLDYYTDAWYDGSLLLHKALGMVVLALVAIKAVWMLTNLKPADLPTLKWWEKLGALVVHKFLLVFMVVMPITGYTVSTSAGAGIDMFGLFEIPALYRVDKNIRDLAIAIHYYLAYGGAVLIAVHIAAALKHHFINKDSTLRRML